MNLESLTAQLANRINQPHVIELYLKKVANAYYKLGQEDALKNNRLENVSGAIRMSFKKAPIGARFKYPNAEGVWVKINSYPKGRFDDGLGLVAKWNGNTEADQSICHFVDENAGVDFNTEVELI